MRRILTLCIIHQHPRILLGMKKRGFGAGRWNGFGGKVEGNESIEEAMKREVKEEAGIEIRDFEKKGVINFEFKDGSKAVEVHIFHSKDFDGTIIESEEMSPKWFYIDEIPFMDMWPDDIYWMPLFFKGKKFKGKFVFDKPSGPEYTSNILEQELVEVDII